VPGKVCNTGGKSKDWGESSRVSEVRLGGQANKRGQWSGRKKKQLECVMGA
jgi:hypothetical protein